MLLILKILKKIQAFFIKYKVKYDNELILEKIKKSGGIVGKGTKFGNNVKISGCSKIKIGNNVHIGSGCFIRAEGGLVIGDNVIISRNVVIYSTSHNYNGKLLPFDEEFLKKEVEIGNNVWIGMNVTISPGTKIGEGAIIGLGSRIFSEIPKLAIVGSTYKIIKYRNQKLYYQLVKEKKFCKEDGKPLNA